MAKQTVGHSLDWRSDIQRVGYHIDLGSIRWIGPSVIRLIANITQVLDGASTRRIGHSVIRLGRKTVIQRTECFGHAADRPLSRSNFKWLIRTFGHYVDRLYGLATRRIIHSEDCLFGYYANHTVGHSMDRRFGHSADRPIS